MLRYNDGMEMLCSSICLGNGSSTVVETKFVLCVGWLQKMIHRDMLYTVYMLIVIILRSSSIGANDILA